MLDDRGLFVLTRIVGVALLVGGFAMTLLTWFGPDAHDMMSKYIVAGIFTLAGSILTFAPMQRLQPVIDWLRVRIG